jgi:hypothetical protein
VLVRAVVVAAGGVLAVAGIVWTLQGVGDISGSFMTGNSIWAVIGPVTAVAGIGIAAWAMLTKRRRGRRG